MPRTKIAKTKRNRDAAKEEREEIKNERLREFDSTYEQMEQKWDTLFMESIEDKISETSNLKLKLLSKIRMMLFENFIYMDENAMNDFNKTDSVNSSKFVNGSILAPTTSALSTTSCTSKKSKDDGYITEDSCNSRNSNTYQLPSFPTNVGRTPGPLSSAKAKRGRRSRSASGLLNSAQKLKPMPLSSTVMNEHSSRARLRTPLIQQKLSARPKAVSADRGHFPIPKTNDSYSPVLCRWAKPGETIFSMAGSPLVTPMAPDAVTNINIPTMNGMLSLRPKRIDSSELEKKIADRICPETLVQIKQLQSHLNLIMTMAGKN